MPDASFVWTSFLGGEISEFAQGRFDRPDYKMSMSVCLNAFPVEIGAWTRRPGTAHAGIARNGHPARVIEFDFEASTPDSCEFSSGYIRFRNGVGLLTTNDPQTISSISTANPAVIQTAAAHRWTTGNTVFIPGASTPLLENRQFAITVVDSTHFSIADPVSGLGINGATLGAIPSGTQVKRIQEITTSYVGSGWQNLRAVQAETTMALLSPAVAPQALTVATLPSSGVDAQFALAPIQFLDGPYLDPLTNGAELTPNTTSGAITLTVSFPAYDSTKAYQTGDFVTYSGTNYQSLTDQNVNNAPSSSPSFWAPVSASAAINNGQGFLGSDVGRLIRLLSEPAQWAAATTYAAGAVISYNPTGVPGASTYWQALVGNTGKTPGADLTNWTLITNKGAAIWSWGKIIGLQNFIPGGTGTNFGNLTNGGGLAAAFNGTLAQTAASSAELITSQSSPTNGGVYVLSTYVGKAYANVVPQKVQHVTVYPSIDQGFGFGNIVYTVQDLPPREPDINQYSIPLTGATFTFNLRAKQTAPINSSDGTLLGTTGATSNRTTSISIDSNDETTAWNYVWVEMVAVFIPQAPPPGVYQVVTLLSYFWTNCISQLVLFNPPGTGATSAAIKVELLGAPLLYTQPMQTWQMGAYSSSTGYPTCGCYDGGRLWLGGAIANRWDASVSNGVNGSVVNMAPTDQFGQVLDSSAMSETFNSNGVNPIIDMVPDLQGIVMLSLSGEWLVQAPTTGPFTPTNVSSRRVTRIGAADVRPIRTEHTIAFVKRYGEKIMEYFADVFSGKFTAPNLADKAQHITRNKVEELAYTDAQTPILWGRCGDGSWFGCTYKRDTLMTSQGPTYNAFHRHQLGTGRSVKSICAGPSTDGALDSLTMATVDSNNVYHVEVLTDAPDELDLLPASWFLDDAVNPTSVSSSSAATGGAPYGGLTINGLWHLNGQTVQVFAGGLDCGNLGDAPLWSASVTYAQYAPVQGSDGKFYVSQQSNKGNDPTTDTGTNWKADFAVVNGSIFVPYGDSISAGCGGGLFTAAFATALPLTEIVVGCTYDSDGQIVRPQTPAETGARTGPAFSKKSRSHFFGAQLVNTLGISFGTSFDKLMPALFKKNETTTPIDPLTTYSGVYTTTIKDDYSRFDRKLCWRVSRPFPATVTAIGASIETQDQ